MRILISMLYLPIVLFAYNLEELIELSHKNRVVESASHVLRSKERTYEGMQSSYLPNIEVGATFQNVYEETLALPQNSLKFQASLKYTLYDGGKKGNIYNQLESNIDAGKEYVEAVKNDISLDVVRLYFEYLSLETDKRAIRQKIEQLDAELQRVKHFYASGSITKDEVDKLDAARKKSLVSLHEIELQREKILHTLEYYTTQKIDTIKSGSQVDFVEPMESELRHDIRSQEHNALSLLYQAKAQKNQKNPMLYFQNTLSYSDYYFDNEPATRFLVEKQNIALVNLSWNIFDFGTITKNYEAKYHEYLSKISTLEYEKHRADVDYRLAKKTLKIARLKIDAALSALEAANSAYELIKFKYQNGTIDNVSYLLALSEKFDAKRDYERALLDLEIKEAELIYYGGKDIKEFLR